MKRAFIPFFGMAFVFAFAVSAGALPSLGAIPEDTLSGWDLSIPFEGPFAFTGGSATDMCVWIGNESGSVDPTVPVWIGSTEDGHSFNSNALVQYADGSPPHEVPSFWHTFGDNYYLPLGTINDTGWVQAQGTNPTAAGYAPALLSGGGEFWLFTATWTGGLGAGEWIYAMADTSGNGTVFDNGGDSFSPPTMSTVPEPATLILLGSGMVGFVIFGRRKRIKR